MRICGLPVATASAIVIFVLSLPAVTIIIFALTLSATPVAFLRLSPPLRFLFLNVRPWLRLFTLYGRWWLLLSLLPDSRGVLLRRGCSLNIFTTPLPLRRLRALDGRSTLLVRS